MKQKKRKRGRQRGHATMPRRAKRSGHAGNEKAQPTQPPWLRFLSGAFPAPEHLLKTSG